MAFAASRSTDREVTGRAGLVTLRLLKAGGDGRVLRNASASNRHQLSAISDQALAISTRRVAFAASSRADKLSYAETRDGEQIWTVKKDFCK